jgi:GNAT superfamily N-acetyltransferase
MALTTLPPGEIGAIVTYLEMTERPKPRPFPASPLRIEHWRAVDPDKYRLLFERIGAHWLWYSRLAMSDPQLKSALGEVHVVVDRRGVEVGMIELDFAEPGQCLISFLGLIPELAGHGHGNWLFAQTLALAWRQQITRVHVHTCTLDHPAALPAYLKAGFRPYKRAIETFPDPRLIGLLPRETAPHIPLLEHGSR